MADYFVKLRIEWIEKMLDVYGFINRGHVERMFGVSGQQATIDFKKARSAFPEKMTYDLTDKCFRNPKFTAFVANGTTPASSRPKQNIKV